MNRDVQTDSDLIRDLDLILETSMQETFFRTKTCRDEMKSRRDEAEMRCNRDLIPHNELDINRDLPLSYNVEPP